MIRVMYLAIHKITMKFTFFHTRENTNNKEKFEFEMGVDSYVTYTVVQHSSEKRGLRSTFLSSEMLQNLLYL